MGRMREWPEPPIVLVHGLWMRGWVMALLGLRLQRAGFRVLRFTYSSMRATLSQNAASLAQFITAFPGAHVVGHSLGGLIGLGRLVGQIARPNDGVVSVSETRLPGTKAQAMLPVSHTQMLLSSAVAQEVAEFLRAGHFSAER